MAYEFFDEELIEHEYSLSIKKIDEKYNEKEVDIMEKALKAGTPGGSPSLGKKIIENYLKKVAENAKKLFELYIKELEENELTDEVSNYIKQKINEKIKEQKSVFMQNRRHERDIRHLNDSKIKLFFDQGCKSILSDINKSIRIKQINQQKAKQKKLENEENIFKFISDPILRRIITRDYIELNKLIGIKAEKSILLICGSIIEALLCDLIKDKKPTNKSRGKRDYKNNLLSVEEWDLSHLLKVSKDNKLINQTTYSECYKIADYRNLIHPGKELREKRKIKQGDPDIAKGALENLIQELSS